MLGGVILKMIQTVGTWKTQCTAKVFQWKTALNSIIVTGFVQKIRTARAILRAWTLQSKEALYVQLQILVELLIKLVTTLACLIVGVAGWILRLPECLTPQRVLKLLKKGQ